MIIRQVRAEWLNLVTNTTTGNHLISSWDMRKKKNQRGERWFLIGKT